MEYHKRYADANVLYFYLATTLLLYLPGRQEEGCELHRLDYPWEASRNDYKYRDNPWKQLFTNLKPCLQQQHYHVRDVSEK